MHAQQLNLHIKGCHSEPTMTEVDHSFAAPRYSYHNRQPLGESVTSKYKARLGWGFFSARVAETSHVSKSKSRVFVCQSSGVQCSFKRKHGNNDLGNIPIQSFATIGTIVVLLRTLTRHYTGPDSPPGGRSHTRLACVTVSYTQIIEYKRHRMWLPRISTQGDC